MSSSGHCQPGRQLTKSKRKPKKGDKYPDLAKELKTVEHESNCDTNRNRFAWNNPLRFGKDTRRLGNKRKSGDHPDYSIFKICLNTEQNHGDLRRLAVTQIPGEIIS